MMTLYHGSYMPVPVPLVKFGRINVDFGQGFYLTRLRQETELWAQTVAQKRGRDVFPTLSIYSFDYDALKSDCYRLKIFETYSLDWLAYVVDCRRCGTLQRRYDLVEGGVANDNVIDTVEDYENGIITAEQALGQLIYKEVNHQICIHNQDIVKKYLTFVSSETVVKGGG